MLKVQYFGADGYLAACSDSIFLPPFLDWMPIELKAVWFFRRGFGPPAAVNALLESQGEQVLIPVNNSLILMKHSQLKEAEDGLEEFIGEYASNHGISRTPRNQ